MSKRRPTRPVNRNERPKPRSAGQEAARSGNRASGSTKRGKPAGRSKKLSAAAPAAATVPAAGTDATSAAPASPRLSDRQRRHLRGLAHELKPIIRLGSDGLTDGVARETERALHDHELIKVKAPGGGNREVRDALFSDLARLTASALVHRIGNVAILYRPRPDMPRILLPDNLPPALSPGRGLTRT